MSINSIECWYKPADDLKACKQFHCEMSRDDHGFLSAIIRKYEPRKVVEIGVAEGGTTAVIVNTIAMCNYGTVDMYSVDLNPYLFCDTSKMTGYELASLRPHIAHAEMINHSFLFGDSIAKQIEKIGNNIDLVIIDTMHRYPGEFLDFLAIFPFMNKDGVVIFHDTNLNYYKTFSDICEEVLVANVRHATKTLLSSIRGVKYVNAYRDALYNIGAVQLTEDTINSIEDVFLMLTATWDYRLDNNMLDDFEEIYSKYYNENCQKLFCLARTSNLIIRKNTGIAWCRRMIKDHISMIIPFDQIEYGSRVILFGAGKAGADVRLQLALTNYCEVIAWVDSCSQNYVEEFIESPDVIRNLEYDCILVTDYRTSSEFLNAYFENILREEKIIIVSEKVEEDRLYEKNQLFSKVPINDICSFSRIVIWGAGRYGTELKKYLNNIPFFDVVAWVDEKYEDKNLIGVSNPLEIKNMDYDIVIVAISTPEIVNIVRNKLQGLNHKPVIDILEWIDKE